jgi:hypothetical protein
MTDLEIKKQHEVEAINFDEVAGMGSTVGVDFQRKDLNLPLVIVLQSGTPFCKKSDPEYIKGAEDGMFYDTGAEELYEGINEGIYVVPCFHETIYKERSVPRSANDRGDLVAKHPEHSSVVSKADWIDKRLVIPETGNTLHECHYYFVMLLGRKDDGTPDEDNYRKAVLCFESTNIPAAKTWNSAITGLCHNGKPAAIFIGIYNLTTVAKKNDKASWWGIKVNKKFDGAYQQLISSKRLFLDARGFYESMNAGEFKVDEKVSEKSDSEVPAF